MTSLFHSPVTFTRNLAAGTSASDLLGSSSNGLTGVPLKALGRARFGAIKRNFTVSAKAWRGKKREYPWPRDPDPNVKGGVGTYLSTFKPLKEKPKPIYLEFEKPLLNLQKTILDVQKLANETGQDFKEQITLLELKYEEARRTIYTHLTPIQRVHIARHPHRPTFLDHIFNITDRFIELHGDRAGYDDPAIVTGLGSINGRSYMFMGHQKGRNTKESIRRNFGMPTPHGYRKALRMMHYADHHGFPIVTFIDTPGAFADLKSEELNQGEAIAQNLRTMFGLKVPIISIVMGEGGSGGALAIGCANKLLMLENAVFYVASPEACAAILYKDAKEAPKAAEKLRITARELCKLEVADGIIPEPLGGAHADPSWTSEQIKTAIVDTMDELIKMDTEELLQHRMMKFRKMGTSKIRTRKEGISGPQTQLNTKMRKVPTLIPGSNDPERKASMETKKGPIVMTGKTKPKKKGIPKRDKTRGLKLMELKREFEELKHQMQSSTEPPVSALEEMISKLKDEVDLEYSEAVEALGFEDRLEMLQTEYAKAKGSKDQPMDPALEDKIEKIKVEFDQRLKASPNYPSLKYKLDMLNELSEAKNLSEKKTKRTLQQEIDEKLKKVVDKPEMKNKIQVLKKEIDNLGVSTLADLNQDQKDKILQVKEEIGRELSGVLKSLGLDVELSSPLDVKGKIEEINGEINRLIDDVIDSSDLRDMVEQFKLVVAKAGKIPSEEAKNDIMALEQQIQQVLAEAINSSVLKEKLEKLEKLKADISEGGLPSAGNSEYDGSKVEVNLEANRSFA